MWSMRSELTSNHGIVFDGDDGDDIFYLQRRVRQ